MSVVPWLALALSSAATAQTTGEVGVQVGVVAGQLGAAVRGGVDHEAGGGWVAGEAGLAVRGPVPYTAIDDGAFPVAGLGTLGGGWRFQLGERSRLGPVAHVDLAVLASQEHDCGVGDGCRHWYWLGTEGRGGAGISFGPAVGLGWRVDGPEGARSDLALGIQPTFVYDLAIPWAPRIDYGWTSRGGWGFDVRMGRYGATAGLSRAL